MTINALSNINHINCHFAIYGAVGMERWDDQVFGRLAGVAEDGDFSTPLRSARNDAGEAIGGLERRAKPLAAPIVPTSRSTN